MESRVQEKGVWKRSQKMSEFWKNFSKKFSKIIRSYSSSTLESPVQEKGIKKWVSFEYIYRKAFAPIVYSPRASLEECFGCSNIPEMKIVKNLRPINRARKLWKHSPEKMHRNNYRSSAEEGSKNDVVVKNLLKILQSYPLDFKSIVCRRKG